MYERDLVRDFCFHPILHIHPGEGGTGTTRPTHGQESATTNIDEASGVRGEGLLDEQEEGP